MADDYDIIIIGAGIAGCSCALFCARAGLSVLLLERGEQPGSKNLSGGRIYPYALNGILPDFTQHAPLERGIWRENISLLTSDSATTVSSQLAKATSWSLLRGRFDPWFAEQAVLAGAQLLCSVTVERLHVEHERVQGVICEGEVLTARYVVLAEGANSLLAQQHGFVSRPAPDAMALGIKEVLALDRGKLEERFQLEAQQGLAWLFSGGICADKPAGAFLYTNQETLSLGIVCPLSSLTNSPVAASELLEDLKRHPVLRPLLRHTESIEYGAHLVPEGGLHAMPVQKGGEGWLLIGDALGSCVNTGFTIRGMDLAVLSAKAAAKTLISACQQPGRVSLFPDYNQQLERSTLWAVLKRYESHPDFLQRPGWYQRWPEFCRDVSAALWNVQEAPAPPLRQLLWQYGRKHGAGRMMADIIRSIRCL